MLRNEILPAIRRSVGDNFAHTWFQQDGVEPHYSRGVRNFLDTEFVNRWIGRREWVATTWFITAWLLFVRLPERQSVCNKTTKFRETSSKDYWRSTHWSRIHQKCRIQFLWSNCLLPNSKWCTIRAFNIIILVVCNTDRSRLDWLDHHSILPLLAALFFNLSTTKNV